MAQVKEAINPGLCRSMNQGLGPFKYPPRLIVPDDLAFQPRQVKDHIDVLHGRPKTLSSLIPAMPLHKGKLWEGLVSLSKGEMSSFIG